MKTNLEQAQACAWHLLNTTQLEDHQADTLRDLLIYLDAALRLEEARLQAIVRLS
jgi:hypothetical protein